MHTLIVALHLIALAITSMVLCAQATIAHESGQLVRLLQPSQAELLDEKEASLVFHDGLTNKTVDTASSSDFNRTDAMLITGVVETTQRPIP